jgi:hypothetical protein
MPLVLPFSRDVLKHWFHRCKWHVTHNIALLDEKKYSLLIVRSVFSVGYRSRTQKLFEACLIHCFQCRSGSNKRLIETTPKSWSWWSNTGGLSPRSRPGGQIRLRCVFANKILNETSPYGQSHLCLRRIVSFSETISPEFDKNWHRLWTILAKSQL